MGAVLVGTGGAAAEPDGLAPGALMPTVGTLSAEPVLMLPVNESLEAIEAAAPTDVAPFRPTMDADAYAALKSAANAAMSPEVTRVAETPLVPPNLIGAGKNYDGVNSTGAGGLRPPDTHGAMGDGHYTQIVNSHTRAYKKSDNSLQFARSLATHFGYNLQTIFDPRVVYDNLWDRWIWTAEAFPESATVQRHFIAISTSKRPHGAYLVYGLDINVFNNSEFWDYPQLGLTQDAVLITANIFDPGFIEARMFAVAKAILYNGHGFSVPLFGGFTSTTAPPIVDAFDPNPQAFFLSAAPAAASLQIWRGDNLENGGFATVTFLGNIPVPAYSVPPNAPQFGTTDTLDTLDSRFVNASAQVGSTLTNVHTNDHFAGFATPEWYEIDLNTLTVAQTDVWFSSGSSHDFNVSVAKNAAGDTFVTWSATDPANGINAQVRFGGRQAADAPNTMFVSPTVLMQSPTFYNPSAATNERWGDYSAVSLDPKPPAGCNRRAWVTNEYIQTNLVWGSRIARIGYC